MFSTTSFLNKKAIRTEAELNEKVPIGGTCWIICANVHTKEPVGIINIIREGEQRFVIPADSHEEDAMDQT